TCTSLDCLKLNSGGLQKHLFPLCAAGQLVFEEFLRSEYSEENLLFWLACENYKTIARETERVTAAKRIYAEFVQVDATRQVWILEEISETLSQPGPNCFDRAQKLIYGLMENDCYPRFLKSEIYQYRVPAQTSVYSVPKRAQLSAMTAFKSGVHNELTGCR
uniref:Regulator of G-protein signaling 1 n=1 Tax=Mola mola TaxID=94237 RepID=A0A3Q4BSR3_MOLML